MDSVFIPIVVQCAPHSATDIFPAMILYSRELQLPGDGKLGHVPIVDSDHKATVLKGRLLYGHNTCLTEASSSEECSGT